MVLSTRAGVTRQLVAPGARAVLLCRYSGTHDGIGPRLAPFRLQASHLIGDPATVAGMARELDSLARITAPSACPAGFGAAIVAHFRYPAGPEDPVTIALDGCLEAGTGTPTGSGCRSPGPRSSSVWRR